MAEPTDTAARLLNDNRTVVGGTDSAGRSLGVVPLIQTVAGSALVSGSDPAGGTATKVNASPGVNPVFVHDADGVSSVTIAVDKARVRKNFFRDGTGDPASGKWCWVNSKGQPLDANGVPTTVALAINAETTALTALGEGVTDYTQRPLPGVYPVSKQSQGSSSYIGWTAQK